LKDAPGADELQGGAGSPGLLSAVEEIQEREMKPAAAIERLLAENLDQQGESPTQRAIREALLNSEDAISGNFDELNKVLAEVDLSGSEQDDAIARVPKAVGKALKTASPGEVLSAVNELRNWDGLVSGRGDEQMAINFPVFWACFVEVRKHVEASSDMWDLPDIGVTAEALVKLGASIWTTDKIVHDALEKTLLTAVAKSGKGGMLDGTDYLSFLGLRPVLIDMAHSALMSQGTSFPPASLASLAMAMATAEIDNTALQTKVARGILEVANQMSPQDVGNIFVVVHEKRWFKDVNTVDYLVKALVARMKDLQDESPDLRQVIQEEKDSAMAQAEPQVQSKLAEEGSPGAALPA